MLFVVRCAPKRVAVAPLLDLQAVRARQIQVLQRSVVHRGAHHEHGAAAVSSHGLHDRPSRGPLAAAPLVRPHDRGVGAQIVRPSMRTDK